MLCLLYGDPSIRLVQLRAVQAKYVHDTRVSLNQSNFKYVSHDNLIDSDILKAMH